MRIKQSNFPVKFKLRLWSQLWKYTPHSATAIDCDKIDAKYSKIWTATLVAVYVQWTKIQHMAKLSQWIFNAVISTIFKCYYNTKRRGTLEKQQKILYMQWYTATLVAVISIHFLYLRPKSLSMFNELKGKIYRLTLSQWNFKVQVLTKVQ